MFGLFKKKQNEIGNVSVSKGGESVVKKTVDFSSFNKAINFIMVSLVVLMPVLFLPITSEVREFNKQALLFFGVVIMLGIWVVKILTTRKVSWTKTSLDYILLVYLAVYLFASLFSMDSVSSFLGYYGRFTGSFISVLSMIVLYYLIVNNVAQPKITSRVRNYLFIGIGITIIYSFFQLMGWYILPGDFTHDRGFNPIGSMVSLALFTAVALVFIQWKWLTEKNVGKVKNVAYTVVTILGLMIMLLVNAFIAWVILALGMVVFLALSMVLIVTEQSSPTWFWKPMLVLVVGILFIAFQFLPSSLNPRALFNVQLPVEIQLSNSTTWTMVKNSLGSGVKNAVLGSGPGTTGIAFGDIKPTDLNKTVVWSLNFDRASSEVANIAIESGLLGLLAFEISAILFLLYGLFFLLKKTEHPGRLEALGFFLMWVTLYITHFFYFFNTTFYFMYWLSLAMFMAITHWPTSANQEEEEAKVLSFSNSPRSALSWMFVSLLLLAGLLVGAFFEAAVYGAEVAYASGIKILNQAKPDFAKSSDSFARAISLNQYRDVYYLAYGQNLIFRASEEAAKTEPDVQQIQTWMGDTVATGRRATELSPGKASNWSALAQFYIGIRPLVSGTDKFILDSWQEAIKRDNKNPSLMIQLARAYLTGSEMIDPSIAGKPGDVDTDEDGLTDAKEKELGSNPESTDTNGNGVTDGDEVRAGFNPTGTGRLTTAQVASFTKVDQSMLKEAEKAVNKAIELKPDLPDSYMVKASILEKENRPADVKKLLDQAAKDFPSNADIRFEQGRVTYNQKNFSEAEGIFKSVLAIQPNYANAYYSLGLIYLQKKDNAKALEAFEKTREITGPNVDLEKLINQLKEESASTKETTSTK